MKQTIAELVAQLDTARSGDIIEVRPPDWRTTDKRERLRFYQAAYYRIRLVCVESTIRQTNFGLVITLKDRD